MTLKQAVKVVESHNKWRRDKNVPPKTKVEKLDSARVRFIQNKTRFIRFTMKKLYYKLFPQKLHWFQIRVGYTKNHNEIFSYYVKIGRVKQNSIVNDRYIKQTLDSIYANEALRPHLCNGKLSVQVICYLGHFKNNPKWH